MKMPNAFHFDGRIAKAPALTRPGNTTVCKFTLIRNEFAGMEASGQPRQERIVSIQFTAFGKSAEAIAQHAMEGDQLIVTARIDNNNYKDKDQNDVYGHNFVVDDWTFGAPGSKKREQLANRRGGQD
jgi:single-strand DNA-binding protein